MSRDPRSKLAVGMGATLPIAPLAVATLEPSPVEPITIDGRRIDATIAVETESEAGNLLESASDLVAQHDFASQPTLDAPAHVGSIMHVASVTQRSSLGAAMRTTVLPRLEHVDDLPRLVLDGKARYEEQRKLGEGGMGEVLHAQDNDIGRPVAVKRLRSEVSSPAALARFVDEIRTVGRLEHPNIIPIHDVGMDGPGEYYFVMKYIDGHTLETIIEKLAAGDSEFHARYGFEARVQIFRGILEAVAFAHSKGILHRDIKPANVMVGAYGEVILMDWGIAKELAAPNGSSVHERDTHHGSSKVGRRGRAFETQVGALVGTPAYMSPEQARGEPLDARSDVYSLSVLFYELLSLNHYLDGKTTLEAVIAGAAMDEVPPAMATISPHQTRVPFDLSWFVKAGTEKDPSKRYPSVQAMLDRLDQRARGEIPVECPVTLVKSINGRWTRIVDRYPFQMVALIAFMILSSIAGVVSLGLRLRG